MTEDLGVNPRIPLREGVTSNLMYQSELILALDTLSEKAYRCSYEHGFYELEEGEKVNLAEKIALMHSELSECLEIIRDDINAISKKLESQGILHIEEEFADVIIRVLDTCGARGWRIGTAVLAKMEYNEGRPYKHGKKF